MSARACTRNAPTAAVPRVFTSTAQSQVRPSATTKKARRSSGNAYPVRRAQSSSAAASQPAPAAAVMSVMLSCSRR
jgi:hypothetical protein